jgi:hypothetical protein
VYKTPAIISPGDIYPNVPVSFLLYPPKISRVSAYTPKSERGPQEFRRIYSHPADTKGLNPPVAINKKEGEECLAVARIGVGVLLSHGCKIDEDLKNRQQAGVQRGIVWHLAPVYDLGKIPAGATIMDPEKGQVVSQRDVVRNNQSSNYFYIDPLPTATDAYGHYIDFRKLTPISIEYFIEAEQERLAALDDDALNGCLAQLMWFFTRASYLHEPVSCPNCGDAVSLSELLEGQRLNLDNFQE